MGKITFTPIQQRLFDAITQNALLPKTFYFTGGTALSAIYLHHRKSEDLDFFSETDFDNKPIMEIMNTVASSMKVTPRFTLAYNSRIFELVKEDELIIKIDFVYQPFKRLKKGLALKGFPVDSLLDIATNKLLTIVQRTEIKDFADLFFLLKNFTVWDLLYAVKKKYNIELDIILLGSDFLKIEKFDYLPKMIKPLSLEELKSFFTQKAKEIGSRAVE